MDAAVINRMLEGRIKDLASQKRGTGKDDYDARRSALLKCLGVSPLPPRTDLKATVTGVLTGEGFRLEKIRYESRPGLLATAHLYVPEGTGKHPLIVSGHGVWKGKKCNPGVQARGISFALQGFATLIVDAPGSFGDDLFLDERGNIGSPGDPVLIQGSPWIGVYVWDLMRGAEMLLGRPDIDPERVGVTGEGDGGVAAAIAFAIEERFSSAALFCTAPTMEQGSLESIAQLCMPGLAVAGDFSDILALCCPRPILLGAALEDDRAAVPDVEKTAEKLRNAYRSLDRGDRKVRFESFEGKQDYNRRMREAAAAFFSETLRGATPKLYSTELRPLTDGMVLTSSAGTLPAEDQHLQVTATNDRQTITFPDILGKNLAEPYPEPFRVGERLAPWLKYSTFPRVEGGETVRLHDYSVTDAEPGSMLIPSEGVDFRLAAICGLGVAEVCAQILHLMLPGRPETWEPQAIGGDALSSMIASMKTLFQGASSEPIPSRIVAKGPHASLVAKFLAVYRPSLEVELTHDWRSWSELEQRSAPWLIQPLARYLECPF